MQTENVKQEKWGQLLIVKKHYVQTIKERSSWKFNTFMLQHLQVYSQLKKEKKNNNNQLQRKIIQGFLLGLQWVPPIFVMIAQQNDLS